MFYSKTTGGFYDDPAPYEAAGTWPVDAVEITDELYNQVARNRPPGKIVVADANGLPMLADPPAPTAEQIIAGFTIAIQARLDTFAQSRNYDGILSACTYATSTVPKFAAEGQYCVDARDATWTRSYEILAEVEAGNRAIPTEAELMAELPVLSWPA